MSGSLSASGEGEPSAGAPTSQTFYASDTYTQPDGFTSVRVTCRGGGKDGGAGGGHGGGYAQTVYSAAPGTTFTVNIYTSPGATYKAAHAYPNPYSGSEILAWGGDNSGGTVVIGGSSTVTGNGAAGSGSGGGGGAGGPAGNGTAGSGTTGGAGGGAAGGYPAGGAGGDSGLAGVSPGGGGGAGQVGGIAEVLFEWLP